MSHSVLTKSNRAPCNSSLRATADILLISSSFLPHLLSSLLTLFGSGLVRAEAAVNTKKDPRDHCEGASDLPGLKSAHCVPWAHFSRSLIPAVTVLDLLEKAGPHLLQVQLPSMEPAPLTAQGRSPIAKSRGAGWGLLPSCFSLATTWCHRQVLQQPEGMLLL